MRIYPEIPRMRVAVAVRDLVVLVLLMLFAQIGLTVHDAVDEVAVIAVGVQQTGGAVRGGFESAAEAVDGAPIVGDDLADALRGAGEGSGGEVEGLGRSGENAIHRLADILGLVVFGLPAIVLLWSYLPRRIAGVRRLNEAERVLRPDASPDRRRVVAMRAAFALPYGQLLAYTRDPLGDLAAERYDALVAAALEDAGLRAR